MHPRSARLQILPMILSKHQIFAKQASNLFSTNEWGNPESRIKTLKDFTYPFLILGWESHKILTMNEPSRYCK